jgi:NAD(P)-dependent dehydrogenase (short-subunit alcohol dehydrogenase family)
MDRFTNKIVVITGGTSGIGLSAKRFGKPEEGVTAVASLASDDASYTGVELAVDGGRTQL